MHWTTKTILILLTVGATACIGVINEGLSKTRAVTNTPIPVKTIEKPYVLPAIVVADIYAGVNDERAAYGLGALVVSQLLEVSACAKANDMITKNYWAHDAPDGTEPWHWFDVAGYGYYNAGENLGYGFRTAQSQVDAWVASPTHEANIVGSYTEMGVCTLQADHYLVSIDKINLIVNHFATP